MDDRRDRVRAPLWLRCLVLGVVLWLAVRIVGNVTESLTGMVGDGAPGRIVSIAK